MNTQPSVLDRDHSLRAAFGLALVTLLVMGLSYSLLGAGLGRMLFPQQATGSLIERDGRVLGSTLVPQPFLADRYFQARPSASNYDPMAAAGSNQARTHPDLHKRIETARATLAAREDITAETVPIELLTQSGSGLDPHVTPQGARVQAARIARARGMALSRIEHLIDLNTEGPQLGVLGQPRVNVLELNVALDALK